MRDEALSGAQMVKQGTQLWREAQLEAEVEKTPHDWGTFGR